MLQAEIDYIKELGVEIRTNISVGKDLTLDDLFKQGNKAIFIATGAQESLRLDIPNIDLEGVFYALPLLKDVNLGKGVKLGGKVAVIGGGNVAIDAARAAIRLGATEVYLACLESREEMPAFKWEIERAEEEGVKIHCSLAPQKIVSKDGRVAGIDFAGVKRIELDGEGSGSRFQGR